VHAQQDELARARLSKKLYVRLSRRLARARALLAGRQTVLLLNTALARWHSRQADERGAEVALLKQQIAGG
jgi:predicted HicB family RNase H-like nuclease